MISSKKNNFHRLLSCIMAVAIILNLCNLNVSAIELNPHLLYSDVSVSDGATGASIANANTSRNLAVADDGTIYAVYRISGQGIYVSTSRDSGASFETPVLIDTINNEPEIAVSSNGYVYVAATTGSKLYLYRSDDQGQSFEKITAKDASGKDVYFLKETVHMATDGNYLYFIGEAGDKLIYNNTGGDGAFYQTAINSGSYIFSDVHVDKETHDVILLKDNPSVIYHVSHDRGLTFSNAEQVNGNVYYSVGTLSAGQNGKYAFIAGQSNAIFRINVDSGEIANNASIDVGNNDTAQGRSLNADAYGNIVSGYTSNGKVVFKVSNDLGKTFGDEYTVATSAIANSFIDPTNGNILYAYQDHNNEIKLNVYSGLTVGYKLGLSTASLYYEASGATKEVVIKNIGNTDLTISSLILDFGFSILDEDKERLIGLTLAPGETDSIPISFESKFAGSTTGLLKIQLEGEKNTRNVILQGVRTDGIIKVKGSEMSEQTVTAYSAIRGATIKLYDADLLEIDSLISTGSGTDTFTGVAFGTGYMVTQTFEGAESEMSYGVDVLEFKDTEGPEIVLIGNETVTIGLGDIYIEKGAEAYDAVDGYLPVTISGGVDTTTASAFSITYSATDTSGNTTSVTRLVQVGNDISLEDLIIYGPGDSEKHVTQNFDYTTKSAIGSVTWELVDAYTEVKEWNVVLDTTTSSAIYVTTSSSIVVHVDPTLYVTTGAAINFGGDVKTTAGADVTRPLLEDVVIVYKATITRGDDITERTYNLVLKKLLNDEIAVNYSKTQVDVIYQGDDTANSVTQDIILTQSGPYDTEVSWKSSDSKYITDDGKVTRPAVGENPVKVVMKATIAKNNEITTKSFTIYVKPEQSTTNPTGDLKGTVTDGTTPLADVEVKVMKNGTYGVQYGSSQTTDENGEFSFSDLPYGTYSLVGTKDGKIITKAIVIKSALTEQNLVMPDGNRMTTVEISDGSASVATNDLENMFDESDKKISQDGGAVTIKLVVDQKDESDVKEDLQLIKNLLGRKTLGFILDIKLTKSISGTADSDVTNQEIQPPTGKTVSITIDLPESLWDKAPYQIVHVHEGTATLIDAEYDSDVHTLTFETNKFSTFSIIYTEPSSPGHTDNNKGKDKDDEDKNSEELEDEWKTSFDDIDGHWAKKYIESLEKLNIVEGYDGKYRPELGITRAEIAVLMLRIGELNSLDIDDGFIDVNADDWYASGIATARYYNLVKGISDTEYEPDRIITRQELTTMMIRLYKHMNPDVTLQLSTENFKDDDAIYDYAHTSVYEAKELGIVEGDNNAMFKPLDNATRAEAATIIYRFLEVSELMK
nr:S-layer homology domain-containing protein [Sedimentibacter sp.]